MGRKQTHDDQSQQQGQNTKQQGTTLGTRKQHKKITHSLDRIL